MSPISAAPLVLVGMEPLARFISATAAAVAWPGVGGGLDAARMSWLGIKDCMTRSASSTAAAEGSSKLAASCMSGVCIICRSRSKALMSWPLAAFFILLNPEVSAKLLPARSPEDIDTLMSICPRNCPPTFSYAVLDSMTSTPTGTKDKLRFVLKCFTAPRVNFPRPVCLNSSITERVRIDSSVSPDRLSSCITAHVHPSPNMATAVERSFAAAMDMIM
mmetsp:Transcript_16511/g.29312  ORF Transcript_16511/g.29312 Transcript_16511/m.29312 type:complete len:219 (+) Transcript_16511:976-1632(+)